MKRRVTPFALPLLLYGCATYSLVEAKRTAIGDLYTVDPQISWSSASQGKTDTWTVDGPFLQAVHFVKGLEDGELLFKGGDEEKRPKFKKHMTPSEIMEFLVDSLSAIGAQNVQTVNLRPERFGDVPGFRFEMIFTSNEGLEKQGLVIGTIMKEQLHLIIYAGTRAHYYPKHKEHVERMIQSISLKGK